MAGTSPDRSKRYESSTESTPGNEPPIPAPGPAKPSPDPRLSLSRDSTPKVDQATAVFSRRALLEAAEAEGLKLDDALRGAATDSDSDSDTDTDTAEPAGRDTAGSRTDEPETGTDEPETGRTGGAGAGGSDEARPDAGRPDADSGDGEADTEGSDAGSRDAGSAAGGPGAGSGDAGADTDSGDGEDPDGAAKSPDGSTEARPDADGAEEGQGADGAQEGQDAASGRESVAGADGEDGEDGDADPRERGAAAPTRAASTARLPAARAEETTSPEPGDDARADAAPGAGAHADVAPETEAEAPVDAAPEAEAQLDVAPEAEVEAPVDAAPEAEAQLDVAPETEVEAPVDAAPEAEAQPDVAPETEVEAPVDAARLDAAPEAVQADDEPEAAVASASGAEARPGSEGDGGAGAGRVVDQPTAIFRAPRPPAVDHPTTMLKLGGGATKATEPAAPAEDAGVSDKPKDVDRSGVSDRSEVDGRAAKADDKPAAADTAARGDIADSPPPAERTSKFVALKSLDEHAPPKPPAAAPGSPATSPAEATRAIPQVGPERTTQQPLPPKPPLDLLAELTNTPPPRQTPVRTIIRRVKIWTPLAVLLVIAFAVAQSFRPLPTPTLALTVDESYAFKGGKVDLPWPAEGQGWMDVNGIGTVDSFGEQKPVAIGSVAKAMTAYVILKEHPMKAGAKGATIPVDAKAETEGGYDKDGESTLNTVKEGDELSQYDAIAAIMIPSANNIARLLARWDSNGSEEEFVKKMNAAAKDLGMTNTTYTDPSGLKETTVSTAEDQVKLGNAVVKMKALTDITRLPEWKDPSGLKHRNYNTLVPYDNAIGIKTGSTTAAGGNLLFAATKEVGGETAIVVGAVLGQHTPPIIDTVNAVSKTAMLAAQDALISDAILKKGDVVGYVDDGLGGQTPVVVTKNVSAVGWAGKTVKLELDPRATIPHEAKSGTEVGSLIVGDGAGDGVEVPVALHRNLTEPDFLTKLTRVG
ncbi:D-alanyl-D-alanine carboxypeptidase [Streptomyces europaeiscabiei]|uniref:D-alanyl-D-alanine carboxypeptidase n=1 Tax=Streptomyces europaeiscabiei TaxID=146819 RepID=UPI0029A6E759|nr:D-alanyl-D-alanine carboxypeptidase [Streptomyces europaeiscabiei]MDX3613127.1 D-alanyl-D-alanine carboxypeptidase [Streptomyces europaeiscabiei]